MSNMLELALSIATEAHVGQYDLAGAPYIEHPKHVASVVETEDEKVVALLHDVLEDTSVTEDELRCMFPALVVDAVVLLTKGESLGDYIEKIKSNPLARAVKIADLRHNMDIGRIPNPTEHDERRLRKYAAELQRLISEE